MHGRLNRPLRSNGLLCIWRLQKRVPHDEDYAEDYVLHLMLLFSSDQDVRGLVDAKDNVTTSSVPNKDASDETSPYSGAREPDHDNYGRQMRSASRRATNEANVLRTQAGGH